MITNLNNDNRGFTLIEIMIVVVIIGIIMTIALPNYFKFSKTAQTAVCIANLEKIDSAIDQWVLENQVAAGSSPDEEEIYAYYVKGGKPVCPSGGTYTVNTVGVKPQVTCSLEEEGHKLP